MSTKDLLKKALAANQLLLSDEIIEKLMHYLDLIRIWNRVFNLTTITDVKEMIYLHIIDSLMVQPYLQGSQCLDVGSGAGLPGIPLALIAPQSSWTLLDKNSKKTRFLTQAIAELGLTNVKVEHSRSEDFQPMQCFDSILSRAFGTISLFIETTEHLLCPGGIFLAMKGKYPQEEIDEMPARFHINQAAQIHIKGIDVERHIICISKHDKEE